MYFLCNSAMLINMENFKSPQLFCNSNVAKVQFNLLISFIHMRLNINGSFDVKKPNTHQTFH